MPVETQDFYRNIKIEIDGEPYKVVECQHVKPGKGVGYVKTTIRNLLNGRTRQETFRSGETYDQPMLESKQMQYLYKDDEHFVFMDNDNYEQIRVDPQAVEDIAELLQENGEVEILFWEDKPIQVDLPTFVDLEIIEAPPGVKGNTAQGGTKRVTLETGAEVEVPLYLERGETVRIDTRSREYVERVNE